MNLSVGLQVLTLFGIIVGVLVILWKVRELYLAVDGRLDQLLKASLAQGRQDERDSQNNIDKMGQILKNKGLIE
jgi:hypothetical protein